MNPRITIGIVGAVTLLLGLFGLFYPERAMALVGFSYVNASNSAATLGEVRAVYGGMILVAGIYTLLSAADPWANQGRLVFLGLLWLGAFGGRLVGVFVDGNPGVFGWLSLLLELVLGAALILAAQSAQSRALPEPVSPNAFPQS
jgi:hypothetical protein